VKAIGRLEPGDVLVVTRLDRLARAPYNTSRTPPVPSDCKTQVLNASTSREIEAAFATFVRERPDALFVSQDVFFRQPVGATCQHGSALLQV
jgi:hypothetical protein